MSSEHRHKIIQAINSTEDIEMLSLDNLSFNSPYASIYIKFKQDTIGNIDHVSIVGNQHNIESYQVTFFDSDDNKIDERVFTVDDNDISVDNVAAIRVVLLNTIDHKNLHHVRLSIRGCFFSIPKFQTPPYTTTPSTKPSEHCQLIDLMDKNHIKKLVTRVGGTLNIPELYKATKNDTQSLYFILEFNDNIFIRQLENISIVTKNHHVEQIRIELLHKNHQLIKRIDLSVSNKVHNTKLYFPNSPKYVQYLKVTVTKGKPNGNITWSIIGCFDTMKKPKSIKKISKHPWWTGKKSSINFK